ncbi:hypothetical protein BD410DRAFT_387529 [Rickenella mellea]|uniref:Uncharacterized protein n=1 Tax=Rickenella mellea TaxID=50990 RepID=A0A4Y7PY69_9AGAM|nr:hypothetical protein BD410DRAFT_387529 [Rickenella mellea]
MLLNDGRNVSNYTIRRKALSISISLRQDPHGEKHREGFSDDKSRSRPFILFFVCTEECGSTSRGSRARPSRLESSDAIDNVNVTSWIRRVFLPTHSVLSSLESTSNEGSTGQLSTILSANALVAKWLYSIPPTATSDNTSIDAENVSATSHRMYSTASTSP